LLAYIYLAIFLKILIGIFTAYAVGVSFNFTNYTGPEGAWVKGIAKDWAIAFFVKSLTHSKSIFKAGKLVSFTDGTKRP
jgi:hypothetical protein